MVDKDDSFSGYDSNDSKIDDIYNKLLQSKNYQSTRYVDITEKEVRLVCDTVYDLFALKPILIEIPAKVFICGDIHGQYYDLLRLFECGGYPPESNYLFLGDYVDRGRQSLETIMLLFCMKIKYPQNIYLLRGNHETSSVSRVYGFYDECKKRLSLKIWKRFCDVFNVMPVSALIQDKILCMHGGLAYDLKNVQEINNIQRPTEVPDSGVLCDLLWSDPSDDNPTEWGPNERGVSLTFSRDVVHNFLKTNNLDLICRGHQVVEDGYEFFADQKLVTIFSAPNYTGEFDNYGGMLNVDHDLVCSFHILKPYSGKGKKGDRKKMKFFN